MSVYHGAEISAHPMGAHANQLAQNENYIMTDAPSDMASFDLDLSSLPPDADPSEYNHIANHPDLSSNIDMTDVPGPIKDGHTSVGAGPLPTSYGMQLAPGAGSTLTEFTKRRNWSQRIVEELRDFLHILSPDGRIVYCSPSTKPLTGQDPQDLIGHFISEFIHPDDSGVFVREFNESIASGNALRFFFRFKKPNGGYTIFEAYGHPHLASEASAFGPNSGASFCRGFFMMARAYPTKNAQLLDSFLEHKIENERLKKRIADLRREEAEEMAGQPGSSWGQKQASGFGTPSNSIGATRTASVAASATASNYDGMPPPARPPPLSGTALTRQNLDEALASSRPDSINDKMARYEGATHLETIEMLTGLRYRDGERSKGISTGDQSPTLIRGDAGIAVLVDKDGKPIHSRSPFGDGLISDKKKKTKVADEYVCTDCGTLDSPEWRKGPNGPKSLCNACGLRWAKKEKREKQRSSGLYSKSSVTASPGPSSSTPTAPQHGQSQVQMDPALAAANGADDKNSLQSAFGVS